METELAFSEADLAYIEANFMQLQHRPENGPGPAYVLPDGRAFYPRDYFEQELEELRFKARLSNAMLVEGVIEDPDSVWRTYQTGVYSVCLISATPENIARKTALLMRIENLLKYPNAADPDWLGRLRDAVDALDALERPFSPHHDRARFGRPPTRDSHIRDVRAKYLS